MNDQTAPREVDPSDASGAWEYCSHCGFPLKRNSAVLRYYGTHIAHQESDCLRMLHAEIARLKNTVRLARADEMYRWASRVDELNAQLRASDARYMALLESVADAAAMLPRTVVLVNGAAEDFPPQCERAPT